MLCISVIKARNVLDTGHGPGELVTLAGLFYSGFDGSIWTFYRPPPSYGPNAYE